MFEFLSSKINDVLNKFSNKTKVNENDVKLLLKDFKKVLLDADVSWKVVKYLLDKINNDLLNFKFTNKISCREVFNKIVIDEFLHILNISGEINYSKLFDNHGFSTILFFGLNGVGKTSSVIKLANLLKNNFKKKVLVVSCDVYRPAAIEQLKILSEKISVDCFLDFSLSDSVFAIVDKAKFFAKINGYNFLIIDSAGRSHVNFDMMKELCLLNRSVNSDYSFLVVDGMVGQDGVKSSEVFCNNVNVSGFFLTKMDSDSKGGVLLSLSFLFKKPIYFLGVGESVDDISYFYPDRLVSRILGFGDLASLLDDINNKIGNVENNVFFDSSSTFNLNDFKLQLERLIKMGGVASFVDKIPGGYTLDKDLIGKFNDDFFLKMIYIINSMTIKERNFPNIINGSRKKRISRGSGVELYEISKMLKYYDKIKKLFIKSGSEKTILNLFKKRF